MKLIVDAISVSTKEKKAYMSFKRSMSLFLLGEEFDLLWVAPGAVKSYCLYAPVMWLISSYGLGSDFCARCRVNSKENLETWPSARGDGNTHPQTTSPFEVSLIYSPHEIAKKGGLGLASITYWRQDCMCTTHALSVYVSDDVDCRALGAPLPFVIVWWLHQVQ